MKHLFWGLGLLFWTLPVFGQSVVKSMANLPDTGQTSSYTTTFGEDHDYTFFPPSYRDNNNGTISDMVTTLMWQQSDGGEMTFEQATAYCEVLALGGLSDWRLPTPAEAFSIFNHQNPNPAVNTTFFAKTDAEYWWTSQKQINDANKVWVTNGGGGIGNHAKNETVSAGGTKKFHARCVRDVQSPSNLPARFVEHGNGTITDLLTGLMWQKTPSTVAKTWEDALVYAESLVLADAGDWRLPNIKELRSISDESFINPSVPPVLSNLGVKKYWSSTSLPNQTTRAWYWNTQFGITTYELKTAELFVIAVRNAQQTTANETHTPSSHPFEVQVFPNPARQKVTLRFPPSTHTSSKTVQLTNLLGQQVFQTCLESSVQDYQIPLHAFAAGLYLLRVTQKDFAHSQLIVLQK